MSSSCGFSFVNDYETSRSKNITISSCQIIAGCVVAFMLYHLFFSQDNYHYKRNVHTVSTMVSTISAKISNTEKQSIQFRKANQIAHIAAKISTLGTENLAFVAEAPGADTDPKAYLQMTEHEKMNNSEEVLKFLKENDTVIVMFFAEWCGHCSNAMLPLNEASQLQPQLPFLIINADTVPRAFLSKKTGGIVDLPHFPYIARYEKGEIEKVHENEMSSSKILSEIAYNSEEQSNTTSDALQLLFS